MIAIQQHAPYVMRFLCLPFARCKMISIHYIIKLPCHESVKSSAPEGEVWQSPWRCSSATRRACSLSLYSLPLLWSDAAAVAAHRDHDLAHMHACRGPNKRQPTCKCTDKHDGDELLTSSSCKPDSPFTVANH